MTKSFWLAVDKPIGITSNRVLSLIKKAFNVKKVGHTGTLDPFASGVLCVAVGEATKTIQYINSAFTKTYKFTIKFGEKTDTKDSDGKIIEKNDKYPSEEEILAVIPKFIGEITQVPPKYSALKVGGRRAYELARKGEEFELQARKVVIHSLKLITMSESETTLIVECSKGTYIRSLGEDIAEYMGCIGHLNYLRRLKDLNFNEANIIKVDFLNEIVHNAIENLDVKKNTEKFLYPVDHVLDDILAVTLDEQQMLDIKQGKSINLVSPDESLVRAKYNDEIVSVGVLKDNVFKPARVFNNT